MSNVSALQSDFDFWEFVNCGLCQLPFASTSGTTVPFWLTECGHVVCNYHLNVDQSCSQCGAQQVQLVPLQRELEAPMSDWFRSVPSWLDAIAFTVKFQLQTMATQIRHYRSRLQRQRVFTERLKRDAKGLKQENETLNAEVSQLRQELGLQHGEYSQGTYGNHVSANAVNSNGKRVLSEAESYDIHHRKATSSPRSITTPLGPDRLTLPQGQQVPNLSSNRIRLENGSLSHNNISQHDTDFGRAEQRPGSGMIEQYAYNPPSTSRFHPQRLSRSQAAPQMFKRTKVVEEQPRAQMQQVHHAPSQQAMRLAPNSTKFKTGEVSATSNSIQTSRSNYTQALEQGSIRPIKHQERNMGPPPIPQREYNALQAPINNAVVITSSSSSRRLHNPPPPTNRFAPPITPLVVPSSPDRALSGPPTTSFGNAPRRFIPSGHRVPSRAGCFDTPGGQRMPFVSDKG